MPDTPKKRERIFSVAKAQQRALKYKPEHQSEPSKHKESKQKKRRKSKRKKK
jgi:hypothetical protein